MLYHTFFYTALSMQKSIFACGSKSSVRKGSVEKTGTTTKLYFKRAVHAFPMVTTGDRPQSGNGSVSQGANLTADWEHKHWFDVASSQCDDGFPEGLLIR